MSLYGYKMPSLKDKLSAIVVPEVKEEKGKKSEVKVEKKLKGRRLSK